MPPPGGSAADICLLVAGGVGAFFDGLRLALKVVCSHAFWADKHLREKLLFTPAVVLGVYILAVGMRLFTAPLVFVARAVRLAESGPPLDVFVKLSCAVFLALAQQVLPLKLAYASLFFDTLRARDRGLAEAVKGARVQHSLKQQARRWGLTAVMAVVGVVAAAALLPLILPSVLAVAAGLAITVPLVLATAGVILVALVLAGGFGYVLAIAGPFIKLYRFDPIFGLLALVCVFGGLVSRASLGLLVGRATELYYSSLLLTGQLLAEYGRRLPRERWLVFQRQHCWAMLGFGLPIWALGRWAHPVFVVLGLQLFQAASSRLVVDEASLES